MQIISRTQSINFIYLLQCDKSPLVWTLATIWAATLKVPKALSRHTKKFVRHRLLGKKIYFIFQKKKKKKKKKKN